VKLSLSTILLVTAAANAVSDAATSCNQFEDKARQIKGCTEYIRQGAAPGPNLAVAYTNRGIAYASTKRLKLAIADFSEAIRLAPDNPFPYYNRANAYFDREDYKQAIVDFDAAIALDADFTLAYYNRGVTYERLGDRAKAIESFEKALELNPQLEAVKIRLRKLGVNN
jgi:tetratricopeptide (TPR) repeat protein